MDVTEQTIDQIKKIQSSALSKASSSVTVGTGLTAYDLQAPAKNLYPVNTPVRNIIPRKPGIGPATNWRVISGITGSGYDGMGWVAEGQRAGAMSITAASKSASYVTLGEEEAITWEAMNAAQGFEDLKATMTMRLLQKLMLKEENSLIGGNAGLALGTTGTPTLAAAGTGATLPAATYSVIVVAMSFEGYRNWVGAGSSIVTGLVQTKTVTGQDGSTFVLNGGYAIKSAAATQAVTLGQTLSCSVAVTTGAVAYAWYVGTAGSEKLEKVTTLNSTTFSAPLAGTGQAASGLAGTDYSRNSSLGYDGLLYSAWASGSGAYINAFATGTPGTGTTLTASGRGSVSEIDTMLQAMWDANQVSPTKLFVNSQQLKDIINKVFTGGSGAPLARYNLDALNQPPSVTAGQVVGNYFNPFSTSGGVTIPITVHPAIPAGTILAYTDNLPVQYQSTNVPNIAEVKARRDYYQIDFPQTSRQQMTGVYSEQVLAVYAPFCLGILTNIAAG